MDDSEAMELDFEQMDKDLRHLSPIQKQEVLAAETFGNFPPKTTAKYAYLTKMMDQGPKVKSVPAGVVAALLDYSYKTKEQRRNFKSDVLQKHPDFEVHWVVSSKRMVQFHPSPNSDNGDVVFPIPGQDKTFVIGANEHGSTQYVFLTPIYARFLLSRSDDRLHTFFIKVHDEVRKMIKGESNVFATAMELEAAAPVPQVTDDERRLKLRRMEFELTRDEAQLQTQTRKDILDIEREHIAWQKDFLKEIDAWDDRAKLHLKESLFNVTSASGRAPAGRALLTNGVESERRLELSTEIMKLGKRPKANDLSSIGRMMGRMYREKYGKDPAKQQKEVNGAVRFVNMYFEKDIDMMQEAIRLYFDAKDREQEENEAKEARGKLFAFGFKQN